jgi:hypothetical protein
VEVGDSIGGGTWHRDRIAAAAAGVSEERPWTIVCQDAGEFRDAREDHRPWRIRLGVIDTPGISAASVAGFEDDRRAA